jgi:hypothetical protein
MEREYDVALWLRSPDGVSFAEYVGVVRAAFPLAAVAALMSECRLSLVGYAAVGLGDGGGVVRFKQGVRIAPVQKVRSVVMASH